MVNDNYFHLAGWSRTDSTLFNTSSTFVRQIAIAEKKAFLHFFSCFKAQADKVIIRKQTGFPKNWKT